MVSSEVHEAAARALLDAARTRTPVAPLTAVYRGLDTDDAYAIQRVQVDAWLAQGRRIVGHKVGLTSSAMQEQMGVNQPDFGVLCDNMWLDPAHCVDAGGFVAPRVEPEVAFRLGSSLRGPGVTVEMAAAAVAEVLPALEIIDSRIIDWRITIVDTIADNASSGAFVLGGPGQPLSDVDIVNGGCVLLRDGRQVAYGVGGAVLGNPLNALAWLANTLATYDIGLEAGEIVLPGSITASQPVVGGDCWTARFEGIGEISVEFCGAANGQG